MICPEEQIEKGSIEGSQVKTIHGQYETKRNVSNFHLVELYQESGTGERKGRRLWCPCLSVTFGNGGKSRGRGASDDVSNCLTALSR